MTDTDYDVLGLDIAEGFRLAHSALRDVEGILAESSKWAGVVPTTGAIVGLAQEAADALLDLADHLNQAYDALPAAPSTPEV